MNPIIEIPSDGGSSSDTVSSSLKDMILASISSGALCPPSVTPEGTSLVTATADSLSISVVLVEVEVSTVAPSMTSSSSGNKNIAIFFSAIKKQNTNILLKMRCFIYHNYLQLFEINEKIVFHNQI